MGPMNRASLGKNITIHWVRLKATLQVLLYGILELLRELRNVFMGHSHFKKLPKHANLSKYFNVAWPGSGMRNKKSSGNIFS